MGHQNYWLLHKLYTKGDFSAARQLIQKISSENNEKPEDIRFIEGLILLSEKKVQAALDAFQLCNLQNPANSEYLFYIGQCLYQQGRFSKAAEAFQSSRSLSGKLDFQNSVHLALSFFQTGKFDAAEENCKQALAVCKQSDMCELLAECLSEQGKIEEAIEAYRMALGVYSTSSQLYSKYGLLCLKLHFNEDAAKAFSAALVLDSSNTKASLALGSLHQENGEYEEAAKVYRSALEKNPDSSEIYNNLAICYFKKNKFVAALSCVQKSLSMDPLHVQTLFNLGLIHGSLHQYTSGLLYWKTALLLKPEDPEILELVAGCLSKLTENAKKSQEKLNDKTKWN